MQHAKILLSLYFSYCVDTKANIQLEEGGAIHQLLGVAFISFIAFVAFEVVLSRQKEPDP